MSLFCDGYKLGRLSQFLFRPRSFVVDAGCAGQTAAQLTLLFEQAEDQFQDNPDILGLMQRFRSEVDYRAAAKSKWTFAMLSPEHNDLVADYITAHSSRPLVALRLWLKCFRYLHPKTGEIYRTRRELAEDMLIQPNEVSRIMSEFERFNAVFRSRNSDGTVRYKLNPHVATHLSGIARDKAQKASPKIGLKPKPSGQNALRLVAP